MCHCAASKKKCADPKNQGQTLIPWYLVHASNRNKNYSGTYGRVAWNGFFSAIVTVPDPARKHGRVLHPEQARVVSVREFARSQGFPDGFHLHGSISDKYRQVTFFKIMVFVGGSLFFYLNHSGNGSKVFLRFAFDGKCFHLDMFLS